jgi:hypothetical protein
VEAFAERIDDVGVDCRTRNYVASFSFRAFVAIRLVVRIRVSKWTRSTCCSGKDFFAFSATARGSCPGTAKVVDHSGSCGARIAGVWSSAQLGQTRRANWKWWGDAAAAAVPGSLGAASDCAHCDDPWSQARHSHCKPAWEAEVDASPLGHRLSAWPRGCVDHWCEKRPREHSPC